MFGLAVRPCAHAVLEESDDEAVAASISRRVKTEHCATKSLLVQSPHSLGPNPN